MSISSDEYFLPETYFGTDPDGDEQYLLIEPHTVQKDLLVTTAVARLDKALDEMEDVINRFPEGKRSSVRVACDEAVHIYATDQQAARRLIEELSELPELSGDLLDAVMFTRSRMNGLDQALTMNPDVADACCNAVINEMNLP
jgi:hypothetical protein